MIKSTAYLQNIDMLELALHILDIAQNSISAGATTVSLVIRESIADNALVITIEDNGKGIPSELLPSIKDPFVTTRTTRSVGMGLSLFESAAVTCGGKLNVESSEGKGTKVTAEFIHNHIDRMPLGNMAETMVTLISGQPDIDFIYRHVTDDKEFELSTFELRNILGEVPLNSPDVLVWIREYINEG